MQILHHLVEKATIETSRQGILERLLKRKLANEGISLSEHELHKLSRAILEKSVEKYRLPSRYARNLTLKFSSEDNEEIERIANDIVGEMPTIIERISSSSANTILKALQKKWPREHRRQTREAKVFRQRLLTRWGTGLEELRMLLTVSREFGSSICEELTAERSGPFAEVLLRLHARSCQIVDEIICLLSGGFADGAMARWRTLDEIAVIACFIVEKGVNVAEKYLAHCHIASLKAARQYQDCCPRLGYDPIAKSEMDQLEKRRNELLDLYGKIFGRDYGWAGEALGMSDPSNPKFSDIEKAVKLDHLRAHYGMASHHVHGNAKGIFARLGVLNDPGPLLAGASNAGLGEPAQCAALSLLQISCTLFELQPTFDHVIALRIMVNLRASISEKFIKAQRRLAKDEKSIRSLKARPHK